MGMLLQYHDGYSPEASEDQGQPQVPADEVEEQPTASGGEQLDAPHAEVDKTPREVVEESAGDDPEPDTTGDRYDDLSDDEVAEAYETNVGGRATKRETQVAALRELDADQPTEGGSDKSE